MFDYYMLPTTTSWCIKKTCLHTVFLFGTLIKLNIHTDLLSMISKCISRYLKISKLFFMLAEGTHVHISICREWYIVKCVPIFYQITFFWTCVFWLMLCAIKVICSASIYTEYYLLCEFIYFFFKSEVYIWDWS